MPLHIPDTWLWFTIAFAVMLLSSLIMAIQGRKFYTLDVVVRKFSILDLEFAATPKEISTIIRGIYRLSEQPQGSNDNINPATVTSALKGQLLVDFFLFMPATYGCIFILCMKVATKMTPVGAEIFTALAYLQVIAFVLDAIENVYLWNKIKPDSGPSTPATHRLFTLLEVMKWGSALAGAICSIFALLHFWVSGLYSIDSYYYILVVAGEIVLFTIITIVMAKQQKKQAI